MGKVTSERCRPRKLNHVVLWTYKAPSTLIRFRLKTGFSYENASKVFRPHYRFPIVFQSFSLSTLKRWTDPKTLNARLSMRRFLGQRSHDHHDVTRFRKAPFSPSTLQHENGVFENIHSGERFRKYPFSVTENAS